MKALFIGGTGTISSACARLALDQGIDLWLMLRGTRDHRIPRGARVIHGDIRGHPREVRTLLDGQTWDCVVDWVAYDEADVRRDVKLFMGKTRRYFFISTTSVYRKPVPSLFVDETTPTGATGWEYADRKAGAERLLFRMQAELGFPAAIVRPGYTYAEFTLPSGFIGMGFGIAERMLQGKAILVHGDGTGLFTLTFNEDFARAFVPLMSMDSAVGETFHIASDEVLSWRRIYDAIAEAFACSARYVYASSHLIARFDANVGASLLGDKAHSYVLDTRKIKTYVGGFAARVPFAVGSARCADWYRRHRGHVTVDRARDALMDNIVAYMDHMDRGVAAASAAGVAP